MEVNAVLLVTSVENVTKSATMTNIQKSGKPEIKLNFVAISAARPVELKALAILNPAPNKKIISYGIERVSSQSKKPILGTNIKSPNPSRTNFSLREKPKNCFKKVLEISSTESNTTIPYKRFCPDVSSGTVWVMSSIDTSLSPSESNQGMMRSMSPTMGSI